MRYRAVLITLAALFGAPALAQQSCVRASDNTIIANFNRWNLALASMDSHAMTDLYWPDAVLVSDPHQGEVAGSQALTLYFGELMSAHPRARVDSRHIYNGCGFSIDVGHYTVSTMNNDGMTEDHAGIFSFVYLERQGQWKVLHQNFSPIDAKLPALDAHQNSADNKSHDAHGQAETHSGLHGSEQPAGETASDSDHHTIKPADGETPPHLSPETGHAPKHDSAHESAVESGAAHAAKHEPNMNSAHDTNKHESMESAEGKSHQSAGSEKSHKPTSSEVGEDGVSKSKEGSEPHSEHANADVIAKVVPAYLLRTGENLQPTAFLKTPPATSPDTVGLKVCLANGQTTAVVADPSSLPGLNEAAIAWAQASHWSVAGAHDPVVCSHVIARFPAAKATSAAEAKEGDKPHAKESVSPAEHSSESHENNNGKRPAPADHKEQSHHE
jgi:hypothetical protein